MWLGPLIVLLVGCSQRAPWITVPEPVTASAPVAPSSRATSAPRAPEIDAAPADATAVAYLGSLLFPVAGADSTRFDDSFEAPRDGGVRRHHAIDIMAARGTPVLSVQDGRVLKIATNPKGGLTVYATDLNETYVYYYAHLDRYQPGLYSGKPLLRGDTLGYVGTTGNSPKDTPHLHFQVMHMPANKQYWNGPPINPYPLLRAVTTQTSGK